VVLCSISWIALRRSCSGSSTSAIRRHEVVVFHILDPDEVDFPYADTATFVDAESGERITTEPVGDRRRGTASDWRSGATTTPKPVARTASTTCASTRARRSIGAARLPGEAARLHVILRIAAASRSGRARSPVAFF
jgi:hypothetical protein